MGDDKQRREIRPSRVMEYNVTRGLASGVGIDRGLGLQRAESLAWSLDFYMHIGRQLPCMFGLVHRPVGTTEKKNNAVTEISRSGRSERKIKKETKKNP